MREYKWHEWNEAKIANHGVTVQEAEFVVDTALRPYPQRIENDKFLVRGQTLFGRYLQVIYAVDPDERTFILHARPLTEKEVRRLRRRRR